MQKRNVLSSPRLSELKQRRRKAVVNKILISITGFLVIFFFLAYLSRFKNINITVVDISGNKVLDSDILKSAVEQKISQKYLWLFPKTNILIYPKSDIKSELMNKYKRIKDINLSIKDNKTLEVAIDEREALFTWCGDAPQVDTANEDQKCYFIDQDGYIFDEAPYFSGEVYFKFYGSADQADSYFYKQNFKQLVLFKDTLVKMKLKPVSLYVKKEGDIEVSLSSGSNSSIAGPKIFLKLDSDYEKIAENLEAALNTDPLQTEYKNKYSSLQYIDLRFGNKVYFK